jgi:serine protease AprX
LFVSLFISVCLVLPAVLVFSCLTLFPVGSVRAAVNQNPEAEKDRLLLEGDIVSASGFLQTVAMENGVVEQELADEALQTDSLQVIVYLQSDSVSSEDRYGFQTSSRGAENRKEQQVYAGQLSLVKQQYKEKIADLADQTRMLDNRYRAEELRPGEQYISRAEQRASWSREDRYRKKEIGRQLDQQLHRMRKKVSQINRRRVREQQAELQEFITLNGGTVYENVLTNNSLGATIPASLLGDLAAHPLVSRINRDRMFEPELNVSVPATGFNSWVELIESESSSDFGIIDTGVRQNHPCLSSHRFYSVPGSAITTNHGTHVAGIAGCTSKIYTGGAPGLDAIMWGNLGTTSQVFSRTEYLASRLADSPEVINFSFGYTGTMTQDYDNASAFVDAFITNYDILIIKSAGNRGWSDLNSTLTSPGMAYNGLTVANMNDWNTADRSDDVIRFTSSVGPTPGGRRKPDITAPGTNVISANSDWASGADYISKTGTSMAAPHVGAAVLLLIDGGNTNPVSQKAVLINTADAYTSKANRYPSDDEPVNYSNWDKAYGWGYMNLKEAWEHRNDYFESSVTARNNTAVADDYKLFRGEMHAGDRATLVWSKRGVYIGGTAPTTSYPLSDLDLVIYDESDSQVLAVDNTVIDNVQQASVNGSFDTVIKVYASSTSFSGTTQEAFTLATESGFTAVAPPSFSLTLNLPGDILPGSTFEVTGLITNTGGAASHGNQTVLALPAGFTLVSGLLENNLGVLAAGGSATLQWRVRAPAVVQGTMGLSIQAESYNEVYTGSVAKIVTGIVRKKMLPPAILHLLLHH